MGPSSNAGKGVAVSLAASLLFGVLYYYATLLTPLGGLEIYGWRTLTTLPVLSLFMKKFGYWPLVSEIWNRIKTEKRMIPLLALSSALLGAQFWLFLWAPVNNRALEVSLGYLLMPLVMVVCGRVFYKERLAPYQKIAVFFAMAGVSNQLYRMGSVSWETLLVALGFPVYFTYRRWLRTDNLGGLWFDLVFMVPVVVCILSFADNSWNILWAHPKMFALIPILGVISGVAMACYILASKFLPMGLFGLLTYAEPVLLVVVSFLLGAQILPEEAATYAGVGLAVATLIFGGIRQARQHPAQNTV